MRIAPAMRRESECENAHMGMTHSPPMRASTIDRRRPNLSERELTDSAPAMPPAMESSSFGSDSPLALEKSWIQVLGAMRSHVHGHHEERDVGQEFPVQDKRTPKGTPVLLMRALPYGRLADVESNKDGSGQGGQRP